MALSDYSELFQGIVGDLVLTISRSEFRCAGCGTVVEEYASGYADSTGWTHCWQPRITDSDGVKFCSEMCAIKHGERL
jgi:hypothetical protein